MGERLISIGEERLLRIPREVIEALAFTPRNEVDSATLLGGEAAVDQMRSVD